MTIKRRKETLQQMLKEANDSNNVEGDRSQEAAALEKYLHDMIESGVNELYFPGKDK